MWVGRSWVHYKKYLEKDKQIDEGLMELYEKNLRLKERALAIADMQKQAAPVETLLASEVEKVTSKSEVASSKMSALNQAIDGKGPGKICLYIMIILGIIGIGYLLYCEGGGGEC